MIKVTLADGSVREAEDGSSVLDVAKSISRGLAKEAVAAKVNGEIQGTGYILTGDCTLEILKFTMKTEPRHSDTPHRTYWRRQ